MFVNPYNEWTGRELGSLEVDRPALDTSTFAVTHVPKKVSRTEEHPSQKEIARIVTDLPVKTQPEDRLPDLDLEEAKALAPGEQPNTGLEFRAK